MVWLLEVWSTGRKVCFRIDFLALLHSLGLTCRQIRHSTRLNDIQVNDSHTLYRVVFYKIRLKFLYMNYNKDWMKHYKFANLIYG